MKTLRFVALTMGLSALLTAWTLCPKAFAATNDNELRVGINASAPPFAFMENGVLVGLEVDLHTEVAKRMGKKLQLTNLPFAGLAPGLQANKWDVAGNTWVNKQRIVMMDFADPWIDAQLSFVGRKADKLTSVADLKGKMVGAEAGTAEQRWLDEHQQEYGPYTIRTYDRSVDILMDLMNKRLDAYLREQSRALYQIKNYPQLETAFLVGEKFVQAAAFRKGDPFRDVFNAVQNEIKTDGTLATLYKKWLNSAPAPDSSTVTVFKTPYQPK